ncbi:hypothetical protein RYX36_016334 [Vicia faba]
MDGGNTCAATYDTYKEICGSPLSKNLFVDQESEVTMKFVEKIKPNSIDQLKSVQSTGQASSFEIEDSRIAESNL